MIIALITGRMGVGKSQILADLKSRSYEVFQADEVVQSLLEPQSPCFDDLCKIFGSEVLNAQGKMNKKQIAHEIFNHPEKKQKMEQILHPFVKKEFEKFAEEQKKRQVQVVFYEVPLLSRKIIEGRFDFIILVQSPQDLVIERLKQKGIEESQIRLRWKSQASDQELKDLVDFVLINDGDMDHLKKQVDLFLLEIQNKYLK